MRGELGRSRLPPFDTAPPPTHPLDDFLSPQHRTRLKRHPLLQGVDWNAEKSIATLKAPLRFVEELEGSETAARCRDPDISEASHD